MSCAFALSKRTNQFDTFKVIGKAILFASMQFAIGSVEMSSKFSVKNFSKDQGTLQNAADALRDYIIIAMLWTLGNAFVFYASYGMPGAWIAIGANIFIILWIYLSYIKAFKDATLKNNLQMPTVF